MTRTALLSGCSTETRPMERIRLTPTTSRRICKGTSSPSTRKTEAKVAEQVLISAYTLSYSDNARREIAVGNLPGYWDYMSSIAQIIGSVTEDELMNLIGG